MRKKADLCQKTPAPEELKSYYSEYWALSDIATAWFIRGLIYERQKKLVEAKESYKIVVEKYSCAYTWDPKGWFWNTAEGAKERVERIK